MDLFSSESVTPGHPDKIADQISDAVLDEALKGDRNSRVACETLVTTGLVVVAGEISTSSYIDIQGIARKKLVDIGYDDASLGIDGTSCGVIVALDSQSPDIAQGIDFYGGAGDQGMMFGYATSETSDMLPMPISAAHWITKRIHDLRHVYTNPWFGPDGKSQVSVDYSGDIPTIRTVVVSVQHTAVTTHSEIEHWVKTVLFEDFPYDLDPKATFHINPTGKFVRGGPHADTGLTGRKIIVDTYGGMGRHGGGAFSGKDPSKVDRSGAYAARQLAKALVHTGVAGKVEVQLAYAIGVAEPVSVHVDTFGTGGTWRDSIWADKILNNVDLTPKGIIGRLGLLDWYRYQETAMNGHFTSISFPWEKFNGIEKVGELIHE